MNKELRIKNTVSHSHKETELLGKKLAMRLRGGKVLALIGDLGSGKTTFTKGLAKGLGLKQLITSPTFVLMKIYPITKHQTIKQLVHIDCYRVPGIELAKIGLGDYLNQPDTLVVIEWAEKIKLPRGSKKIYFKHHKTADRRIIRL